MDFDPSPVSFLTLALTCCLIKSATKFEGLVNLRDDECVEDDDGDVGDDLQDDYFAPEIVEMLIQWIFSHRSLTNRSFVDVWKNECFQLKKL